jgi:hypothetical protein
MTALERVAMWKRIIAAVKILAGTRPAETEGMTITARHIEAAADHLARCAAESPKDGMLFEHFVEGDAWYDQGPLAVSLGLDRRYGEYMNIIYSYLGLIFFVAADHAIRAGLGHLEPRGQRMYFMLTDEGRQKYPPPSESDDSMILF